MIYAVKMKDGSLSIVRLLNKTTIGDEIAKWSDAKRENVLSFKKIREQDIPKDRDFRGAWQLKSNSISVDMEKARPIHMDRIREARNKKLQKLDIETLKGNDVQSKKQALRDIPQNFDLSVAKNPDELKALWPQELEDE